MLAALGLLAFVVGLFIAHAAIGLALEQRRGLIRNLRACGVSLKTLLGALVLHVLADLTRNLFGELPGINMVIYGVAMLALPPKARWCLIRLVILVIAKPMWPLPVYLPVFRKPFIKAIRRYIRCMKATNSAKASIICIMY